MRRSGKFPEPIAVSERIFGWRQIEIDTWLDSRTHNKRY
jgi:predicted DNA-binding transcriptional regulator AlpA